MGKKDEFKSFVKLHPEFIKYVENGSMTWQKFYELYDLYGENNSIWSKYLDSGSISNNTNFSDIISVIKKIDVDKLQSGIVSLQKTLGLVSDLFIKEDEKPNTEYTPRPLYRSFED